jgi:hypothetical protein
VDGQQERDKSGRQRRTRKSKGSRTKSQRIPSLEKLKFLAVNALKEPIPGSLRRRRKKWITLSAPISALVWKVLTTGAPLMFNGRPPPPRTIRARPLEPAMHKVVADFVNEGLATGEVQHCRRRPKVISPLFVIPKKTEGEWRVIIDLRYVNRFQTPHKFRMEDLSTVAALLRPGDWMTSIDFKSGFFHVEIEERLRDYLGFQHAGKWYRYQVLPFGSSSSPLVFTKMVRPAIQHLRSLGIRIVAYMDDILIIGRTKEETELHTRQAMDLLLELGWKIRLDKSELEPSQNREFLGMLLDTTGELPVLRVPYKKKRKIRREVKRLILAAAQGTVRRRRVAQVAGLCNSISKAVAPTRALTRGLMRAIGNRGKSRKDWDEEIFLPQQAIDDLAWWLEFLENWNGRCLLPPPTTLTLETDASNLGWGGHLVGRKLEAAASWPQHMKRVHINVKELTAVELALKSFQPHVSGQVIRVNTDNQVTLSYLKNFTGRKPELEAVARRIMKFCLDNGITLAPTYIPGETNTTADALSRIVDPHDWTLSKEAFQRVCRTLGRPTVDRFASELNHQLPRFNSRHWSPKAEAADAMAQIWKGELNYLAPPIRMIGQVLRKCQQEGAEAILVAPIWKGQPWYEQLQQMTVAPPMPLNPRKDLLPGPSGKMEPRANPKWKFAAFRISGACGPEAGERQQGDALTTGHTVTNSTDTLQGLWSLPGAAKSTPSEVERRQ